MKPSWPTRSSFIYRAVLSLLPCVSVLTASASEIERLDFDRASGFYESAFRLNLTTRIQGATIYYTTDGTLPDPENGQRYSNSIPLSSTTIVRAAAFSKNNATTEVETRTFLFPSSIFGQSSGQLPKVWGTNSGSPIPGHYTMSFPAQTDTEWQQTLLESLQAIPTLSIVTDPANLFSPTNGIYVHPMQRGNDWERPACVELFGPSNQTGFRIDCGLRIHGGMSRHPEESPKHSLRLLFKRQYGKAKLNAPLFDPTLSQEFDELILRAGGSDSWLDGDGERRHQATYIRDEWMRQSMTAMGYPSARGRFVQVYLNGLYWGVYNLCERPDASLRSTERRYDVLNADQTKSGDRVVWDKLMALADSGVSDPAQYEAIWRYLDLTQFADYLILNFYAGNSDWDRSSNWYAIRPRTPDGKFQFFVWDAERTFGEIGVNTLNLDDDESPLRLFHKLCENAAFRALFARRVQHLLFDNGPLSPAPAAERFRRLSDSIAPALIAEAARWGSYRAKVHQYKSAPYETLAVQEHWQPEVDRILSRYIPKRREILLEELRDRGLF